MVSFARCLSSLHYIWAGGGLGLVAVWGLSDDDMDGGHGGRGGRRGNRSSTNSRTSRIESVSDDLQFGMDPEMDL